MYDTGVRIVTGPARSKDMKGDAVSREIDDWRKPCPDKVGMRRGVALQQPVGTTSGRWPAQPAGRVPLLEVDPDLAGSASHNGGGAGRLTAPVFRFATGKIPEPPPRDHERELGFLVLKGLLLYESVICGRAAAELLGPGELVRFPSPRSNGTIRAEVVVHALEPTLLADLSALDARHPEVIESLALRAADRAERVAVERSIGSHVRVDVRVLAYLWHLADRFGVVGRDGIKLDLPLTHATLARLVGARRPTVTTALQRLTQLGYIAREGRTYRLIGDASSVDDLDRRSPARDFAYPDGGTQTYSHNGQPAQLT